MSFPRGFALELTIEGIRDVYGCSQTAMLPYLWLVDKGSRGAGSGFVTPAMETGIRDHVWSIEELCNLRPENHKIGSQIDKGLILKALRERLA
jgi:hypothetical protein